MADTSKLRFTKEHEWVYEEGNTVTVGITEYAAKALGDIVFVELPQPDAEYAAGDIISTVESVKTVSDVFTPVAGKVVEANGELEGSPEKVNQSPYDAWIVKLDASAADLTDLMTETEYLDFCKVGEGE